MVFVFFFVFQLIRKYRTESDIRMCQQALLSRGDKNPYQCAKFIKQIFYIKQSLIKNNILCLPRPNKGKKNLPKPAVWHLFLIKCPQIFFVSKSIHSDSPILPLSQSELLLKLFFYGEHEKRNEERSQDFCINELSRLRDPGCALSLTMHSRCFCPLLSLFMQSSNKACCLQTGKECPHPQKLSVANV